MVSQSSMKQHWTSLESRTHIPSTLSQQIFLTSKFGQCLSHWYVSPEQTQRQTFAIMNASKMVVDFSGSQHTENQLARAEGMGVDLEQKLSANELARSPCL